MTQNGQLLLEAGYAGSQGPAALPWGFMGFYCPAIATSLLALQNPSKMPRTQNNRQRRPQISPNAAPYSLLGNREVKGLGHPIEGKTE